MVSSETIRPQQKTVRLAWAIMLVTFSIFCGLVTASVLAFWYYQSSAMTPGGSTLIVRAPVEWITVRRANRTTFERADDQQIIEQGDRVRIASSAGYGQAATIRVLEQHTLDLWARADLVFEQVQTSTWNKRALVMVIQQNDGYVRYDLAENDQYEQMRFIVRLNNAEIELMPGGSYSIGMMPTDRRVLFVGNKVALSTPMFGDVAVRSTGQARIRRFGKEVIVGPGQRVVLDPSGQPGQPQEAVWELIRDGVFRDYSEIEYNNTTITDQAALPRARSWKVFSGFASVLPDDTSASGFFRLSPTYPGVLLQHQCSLQEPCRSAWFLRQGGQTRPFITGIRQMLGPDQTGIDISEYPSLVFSIWVHIAYQSIELAGERGTECPVMIRFLTKQHHPTDAEQERVICFYTSADPAQQPEQSPGVVYYRLSPLDWQQLQIELRAPFWLPEARYLRSIEIYANGHDYDAQVTGISLIGSQDVAAPGKLPLTQRSRRLAPPAPTLIEPFQYEQR
ncbi:MAG: hypothetical protein HC837_04700 [Chloroflexaceae bacterium]|nr:hypothetical protein [Chloroflexaceae bacterium]